MPKEINWRVDPDDEAGIIEGTGKDIQSVAVVSYAGYSPGEEEKARARFIVQACNLFKEMSDTIADAKLLVATHAVRDAECTGAWRKNRDTVLNRLRAMVHETKKVKPA